MTKGGPSGPAALRLTRRTLVGGGLAGGVLAPFCSAAAQAEAILPDVVVTGTDTIGKINLRNDPFGRITTRVMLNGQGPFQFFVDTGANRSALTAATAARIGATPLGTGLVHSVEGAEQLPMVGVKSLRCGAFEQENAVVPILNDDLISPLDGMLGMERFSGLRLEFDNATREMTVKRGSRPWAGDDVSLPADIRFGQLVSAKGRIAGHTVPIIFDTGAHFGLANIALRELLTGARPGRVTPIRVSTATKPIFVENSVLIPEIRLQNVTLVNAPAYVGDYHIFKIWGLLDTPALIVGMHVLKTVKRFAIDYRRRELQFVTSSIRH